MWLRKTHHDVTTQAPTIGQVRKRKGKILVTLGSHDIPLLNGFRAWNGLVFYTVVGGGYLDSLFFQSV
jgi:hypothetical protein